MKALDISNDGNLDYNEFKIIGKNPEIMLWLASMDVDTRDMETLFELLDEDEDGSVTTKEMLEGLSHVKGVARSIDVLALRRSVDQLLKREQLSSARRSLYAQSDQLGADGGEA